MQCEPSIAQSQRHNEAFAILSEVLSSHRNKFCWIASCADQARYPDCPYLFEVKYQCGNRITHRVYSVDLENERVFLKTHYWKIRLLICVDETCLFSL